MAITIFVDRFSPFSWPHKRIIATYNLIICRFPNGLLWVHCELSLPTPTSAFIFVYHKIGLKQLKQWVLTVKLIIIIFEVGEADGKHTHVKLFGNSTEKSKSICENVRKMIKVYFVVAISVMWYSRDNSTDKQSSKRHSKVVCVCIVFITPTRPANSLTSQTLSRFSSIEKSCLCRNMFRVTLAIDFLPM